MNTCLPQNCRGFTLTEVLVSVLILGFGLLGMAALQALGLRYNQTAYLRSQATQLAYDITDRMRANPAGAGSYTGTETSDNCVTNDCTPPQMAGYDLKRWHEDLAAQLPDGTGTINLAGAIYSITISWSEREQTGAVTQSFVTSLQL